MKYGWTWEPLRKVETFVGRNLQSTIILWTVVLIKYSYLFQTATTISHDLHILFKIYQSPFKVSKCNTQHRNRVTDAITKLRVLSRHLLLTLEWYRGTLKPLNKVLCSQSEDLVENNFWNWCFHFNGLCTCWIASVVSNSLQPHGLRPSGSPIHEILQARILEWVAMTFSRGSSQPGMEPSSLKSPALAGRFLTTSTTWEALNFNYSIQMGVSN